MLTAEFLRSFQALSRHHLPVFWRHHTVDYGWPSRLLRLTSLPSHEPILCELLLTLYQVYVQKTSHWYGFTLIFRFPLSKYPDPDRLYWKALRFNRHVLGGAPKPGGALDIIYSSKNYLFVNKPCDVVLYMRGDRAVRAAHAGVLTVEDMLMEIRKFREGYVTPFFVHRLDYGTSGVMCIAINASAAARVHAMFKFRHTEKHYLALVAGHVTGDTIRQRFREIRRKANVGKSSFLELSEPEIMEDDDDDGLSGVMKRKYRRHSVMVNACIGESSRFDYAHRRQAVMDRHHAAEQERNGYKTWKMQTRVIVVEQGYLDSRCRRWLGFGRLPVTKLLLVPRTGRTHQLRVTCAQLLGCPIVGDHVYAGFWHSFYPRMCLHAHRLRMPLKFDSLRQVEVRATDPFSSDLNYEPVKRFVDVDMYIKEGREIDAESKVEKRRRPCEAVQTSVAR